MFAIRLDRSVFTSEAGCTSSTCGRYISQLQLYRPHALTAPLHLFTGHHLTHAIQVLSPAAQIMKRTLGNSEPVECLRIGAREAPAHLLRVLGSRSSSAWMMVGRLGGCGRTSGSSPCSHAASSSDSRVVRRSTAKSLRARRPALCVSGMERGVAPHRFSCLRIAYTIAWASSPRHLPRHITIMPATCMQPLRCMIAAVTGQGRTALANS